MKVSPGLEALRRPPGRIGVGVTDEEDGLVFVTDHAEGQVVRGGVLAHHAGGDDKEAAAGKLHLLDLPLIQHGEVQRVVQLQVGILAMGAVRFQVVDFREDAAQAADVNRLGLEVAFAHQDGQQGEDLLRAPEGEGGNQDRAPAAEHALDGLAEALDFSGAREARRGADGCRAWFP